MGALLLCALMGVPAYWVDGTFADGTVLSMDRRHDPSMKPSGLIAGREHEVGDTVNFWAQDYTNDPQFTFYLTSATCRYVGEDCYIFVEDAVWDVHYDQESVDAFAASLEDSTPGGGAGMMQILPDALGPVPDEIDGDPRVYFLVLDILDGFDPAQGGVYIAGFFSPYNQFTDEEAYLYYGGRSNEVEMLYIDCSPAGSYDAAYTASHEMVHLIQWGIEPFSGEALWVSENQAQTGTYLCGYPAFQVETFIELGGVTPVDWTEFEDLRYVGGYGAGYLFFSYLYERWGGADFIYNSLRAGDSGLAGVAEAIEQATGTRPDMDAILEDWMLACWIDDPSVGDGRWGWQGFRLADYDTLDPGSRPGLDLRGDAGPPSYSDPLHPVGALCSNGYRIQGDLGGSFRASATGTGDLRAWFLPEEVPVPQRIEAGAGNDISLQLPAEGTVLLACSSFRGFDLEASAGPVAGSSRTLAIYPQPCFGTLYFQFISSGEPVSLAIFDMTGALADEPASGNPPAGEAVLSYTGASELASGIYFYRLVQGGTAFTGRFAVVR